MNARHEIVGVPHAARKPFRVVARGKCPDSGRKWVRFEADHFDGDDSALPWVTSVMTVEKGFERVWVSPSVSYWDELQKALSK